MVNWFTDHIFEVSLAYHLGYREKSFSPWTIPVRLNQCSCFTGGCPYVQSAHKADLIATGFSVGLGDGECCGQHTVGPNAKCARNGRKCPNSFLMENMKDESALLLQRLVSTLQGLARFPAIAKCILILCNCLNESRIIWRSSWDFKAKICFESFYLPFFVLFLFYF